MKIIIYTASADKDAKTNYLRLVESRQGNSSIGNNEKHSILEFISGKLVDPKKILEGMALSDRENLEIEFIAHGNSNSSNELLIMTPEKVRLNQTSTFVSITPKTICDFFNETGKEDEIYKFKKITLFCCQSFKFGKELSELMPGVNVTCFNEDIRINHDGIAYNGQNQGVAAIPYAFYLGKPLDENENKPEEKKAESASQAQTASTSTLDTLSALNGPHIIRGNPWAKYNPKPQDTNQQTVSNKAAPSNSAPSLTESDTTEVADENITSSFKPK